MSNLVGWVAQWKLIMFWNYKIFPILNIILSFGKNGTWWIWWY